MREPIAWSDLTDLYSEVWLAHLRSGHPAASYYDLTMRVLPIFKEGNERFCDGFIVQATDREGATTRCQFDIQAVYHVAQRASKHLVEGGILQPGSYFYYEVIAERSPPPPLPSPVTKQYGVGTFISKHAPLNFLNLTLGPLLEKARTVGSVQGWTPVFYTHEVFETAERFSREGAKQEPPQESGGVILGSLCSCPESGEFFVLATEVVELTDAEQASFSLRYSSKTWSMIQEVVRARQANPGTGAVRMVGQCHGHNFLPCADEDKSCKCENRETCQMTSAFVSEHDLQWSRSVFARQPWAFCHIFGLSVRGEAVHHQFGFRAGRLMQRGFYLIDRLPTAS